MKKTKKGHSKLRTTSPLFLSAVEPLSGVAPVSGMGGWEGECPYRYDSLLFVFLLLENCC